jgi:flagellar biogenesis protein FliO
MNLLLQTKKLTKATRIIATLSYAVLTSPVANAATVTNEQANSSTPAASIGRELINAPAMSQPVPTTDTATATSTTVPPIPSSSLNNEQQITKGIETSEQTKDMGNPKNTQTIDATVPNTTADKPSIQPSSNSQSEPQPAALSTEANLATAQTPALGQGESIPLTSLLSVGCLILGLGASGLLIVRFKNGRGLSKARHEKQMQLINTLALSPKRQILLVRIRDKEIALAATEHGITMLTEVQQSLKSASQLKDDDTFNENHRLKNSQRLAQDDQMKMLSSGPRADETVGQETGIARSEMLVGALKNLRAKNLKNKPVETESANSDRSIPPIVQNTAAERTVLNRLDNSKKQDQSEERIPQPAFPKYLANAFAQESKRTLASRDAQNQAQNVQQRTTQGNDEAGNVTNMIRERLKELRPLA